MKQNQGSPLFVWYMCVTCDDEALVVFQCFSEEAGDDELRIDDEPNLFLDQSVSCDSSAYKSVCKVHLVRKTQIHAVFSSELSLNDTAFNPTVETP